MTMQLPKPRELKAIINRKAIEITCPNCNLKFCVYHLKWTALVCSECGIEMTK